MSSSIQNHIIAIVYLIPSIIWDRIRQLVRPDFASGIIENVVDTSRFEVLDVIDPDNKVTCSELINLVLDRIPVQQKRLLKAVEDLDPDPEGDNVFLFGDILFQACILKFMSILIGVLSNIEGDLYPNRKTIDKILYEEGILIVEELDGLTWEISKFEAYFL